VSLQELKASVLGLPEKERHEFVLWASRLEQSYGDVDPEAVAQIVAEVWDEDDHHAPPKHPAR
jgi:hypothetical protein